MNNIISILTDIIIEHLNTNESGADIIQIFDTHSNVLDYSSKQKLFRTNKKRQNYKKSLS